MSRHFCVCALSVLMLAACDELREPTYVAQTGPPPLFTRVGTFTTYGDRSTFLEAAPPSLAIDFSTTDEGAPITDPSSDTFFAALSLRGATFYNVRSYWNTSIYQFPKHAIRVALPAGSRSFGADLSSFYGVAGDFTIRLATGEVFSPSFTGGNYPPPLFFGAISEKPIEWVEFSFDNDYFVVDNFVVEENPNSSPLADAGGPYTGSAGAPVQFDGSGSSDADGDSLTYVWDFGDGSIGTGPTPTHTYSENGPYAVTLTVTDSPGASATDTTTTEVGHKVVLTVTGSPPVPGVVVTAVKATGADGEGEYQVQLTDAAGQATFYLSDAGWLFHARNLGDRGPEDDGFFLARAPLPEGQGLLQTGTTEGVNHVGVFYDPAAANTSVTYNPLNLERLTANPVVLSGGSTVREIGVDFEAGATVTCDLRNEDGSPLVVPAPENVFLIVPHRQGATLPPLPAGIPGSDLPRAMLVSAATIQAGANTCSLAGVSSSDGYEAAPVLETNSIIVNGEEKVFVQPVEVTQAEANSGSTVKTLIVAEPKRARLEYVEDAWDDTRGDGDLGLLSYGWTLQNQRVSDVFALAAHVRGESQYALHIRYTDPATGREQSIRSTLEWDAGEKEWTVVEQTPHRLPAGVEVRVTGYAEGSGVDLEGTAIWRVTLPGVDELEFRAIGGSGGRFDFAPDRDFRKATKPAEGGNTWLVGVSEEE